MSLVCVRLLQLTEGGQKLDRWDEDSLNLIDFETADTATGGVALKMTQK